MKWPLPYTNAECSLTNWSQAERERERLRQKELQLRSEERFRMEELERERQRQRAIHRKQREEAMQLEREKERLRYTFHGIVLDLIYKCHNKLVKFCLKLVNMQSFESPLFIYSCLA